jgi:hypothetical protein
MENNPDLLASTQVLSPLLHPSRSPPCPSPWRSNVNQILTRTISIITCLKHSLRRVSCINRSHVPFGNMAGVISMRIIVFSPMSIPAMKLLLVETAPRHLHAQPGRPATATSLPTSACTHITILGSTSASTTTSCASISLVTTGR